MSITVSFFSIIAEGLSLLSLGSVEVQTGQSHPTIGIPCDDPVPNIVILMCVDLPFNFFKSSVREACGRQPMGLVRSTGAKRTLKHADPWLWLRRAQRQRLIAAGRSRSPISQGTRPEKLKQTNLFRPFPAA